MRTGFENQWDVLCCDNSEGACDYCSPGTLAYVLSAKGGGEQRSYTWVRFCPSGLQDRWEDAEIGLTVYHELTHLTSGVTDYAYDKTKMVKLAISDPTEARMNADTYTMYVAQTGMTRDEYDTLTTDFAG